jgi:hypothetical protein
MSGRSAVVALSGRRFLYRLGVGCAACWGHCQAVVVNLRQPGHDSLHLGVVGDALEVVAGGVGAFELRDFVVGE